MSTYSIHKIDREWRKGAGTGYSVVQKVDPGSMPELMVANPGKSLEAAKAAAENLWLADAYAQRPRWGTPLPDVYWAEPAAAESGICVLRVAEPGSLPKSHADSWKVWHTDLFDRECPPNVEVTGDGLVRGLVELWTRELHQGLAGLSGFALHWNGQAQPIKIVTGNIYALDKLRGWAFGGMGKTGPGRSKQDQLPSFGDPRLLPCQVDSTRSAD